MKDYPNQAVSNNRVGEVRHISEGINKIVKNLKSRPTKKCPNCQKEEISINAEICWSCEEEKTKKRKLRLIQSQAQNQINKYIGYENNTVLDEIEEQDREAILSALKKGSKVFFITAGFDSEDKRNDYAAAILRTFLLREIRFRNPPYDNETYIPEISILTPPDFWSKRNAWEEIKEASKSEILIIKNAGSEFHEKAWVILETLIAERLNCPRLLTIVLSRFTCHDMEGAMAGNEGIQGLLKVHLPRCVVFEL